MELDGKVAVVTGAGNVPQTASSVALSTQPDKGTDYDSWIGQAAAQFLGSTPAGGPAAGTCLD